MRHLRHLSVTIALVAGCSEDTLDVDQFVDDYLVAYCSYAMRCCDSPERSFTTKQACIDGRRPRVDELLAFREADTSFATFDTGEARSCIDALSGECEAATAARGCLAKVTRGQHEEGEDCTYSAECESFYCIQPQKGAKGYCAPVGSGGGCSGDDRACSADAYCDAATMQCTPRKGAGEICHRPAQCTSGVCSPQKLCVAVDESKLCDGE